jgi:hypothetical protein
MYITMNNRFTTKGWQICISWKDGMSSLADIKHFYPLELARYAKSNNLQEKPAFSWWVKHVKKHQKATIKATKRRYLKRTHKFGIRVSKTVEEAIQIDQDTKITFWRVAIHKEMSNCQVAFKAL